jgi:sortase A
MRRSALLVLATLLVLPCAPSRAVAATHASPVASKSDALVFVGRISIPRLKVSTTIYKGVTDLQFDRGVGYWPGTGILGGKGNVVLGGHRTSNPRPFYNIEKMKVGDLITVSRPGKSFRYRVQKVLVVKPSDVWILDPTSRPTLTLFTCHPRGSTSKRYVVRATLLR